MTLLSDWCHELYGGVDRTEAGCIPSVVDRASEQMTGPLRVWAVSWWATDDVDGGVVALQLPDSDRAQWGISLTVPVHLLRGDSPT